jgi:hypothetical protein
MLSDMEQVPVTRWDHENRKSIDTGTYREQLVVGTVVKVTDETGVEHFGLVTAVHGPECINVVYVSTDPTKRDPYGHQTERLSSLQKQSEHTALNGRFYVHI